MTHRIGAALVEKLGIAILSGTYPPGAILPGELDAGVFNVSRTTYREAIRTLIAKGLVETRSRTGSRVQPRTRWHLFDNDVLSWAFAGTPDPRFLKSMAHFWLAIGPGAATLASARRDVVDLQQLRNALECMALHEGTTDLVCSAQHTFHCTLFSSSKNDALLVFQRPIKHLRTWLTSNSLSQAANVSVITHYNYLYQALHAADGDQAALAMRSLIKAELDNTIAVTSATG